jgi:hypothetical protein
MPRQIFGALGPSAGGHAFFCAAFRADGSDDGEATGNNAAAPAAFIICLREKPDFIG